MYQRICLVHYHEIGLKGHNRASFEKRLQKNLEDLLAASGNRSEASGGGSAKRTHPSCLPSPIERIRRISGRLCIIFSEGTDFPTACAIADFAARIPGVARVSIGYKCPRDLEVFKQVALDCLADAGDFETFRVSARRNHTDFEIDSMELNRLVGAFLCEAFPEKRVKLKDPDVNLGLEVVEGFAYLYARSKPGIGGMPVGSAGKVMCLLSSGIDSPVALWRLARRGAICYAVHFSGRPQTSSTSEYLVREIAEVLQETGCIAGLYVVAFGDYQKEIAAAVPPELRVIVYRRLMLMVAQALSRRCGARALVTGESLGQVASQTLSNLCVTDAAASLPIFRPLIGYDKMEIVAEARELGSFEISSQDAPDCCTL
ncbi:MAG: tRNA 4-thiouridine(8) synthase ThiI, partial [Eggerthellaceae bacterium]|nr:tRNA 4-thiouridine(8) synthase ThiI [Eggerthellaceae bacterium]